MSYQSQISLLRDCCEASSNRFVILELEVLKLYEYINSHSLPSLISQAGLISPSPLTVIIFEAVRKSFSGTRYKIKARKLKKRLLDLHKYMTDINNQIMAMQVRYEKDPSADPTLRASLDQLKDIFGENFELLEDLIGISPSSRFRNLE